MERGRTEGDVLAESTKQLQEEVQLALRDEDYDALLTAFLQLSQHKDNVQDLPSTFLAEVIRELRPRNFVDPAKQVYQRLHPSTINCLSREMGQLKDRFLEYTDSIRQITTQLAAAGKRLGIREYKALLDASSATGDAELALYLWHAMPQTTIEPDTTCYNYLFEALSWNNAYEPHEAYRLRVTPRNLRIKAETSRKSHRSPQSLKGITMSKYREMVQNGITANTRTYSLLLLAMSRDGDLDSVKRLLQKVWDVNIDDVLNDDRGELNFESNIATDSPLYPDQGLLAALAHIFGSNNQTSTALRVVDHIARKFDLIIDLHTWSELAEWTFIHSTRRFGTWGKKLRRREIDSVGQLPKTGYESLWQTMTAEPYNIVPTDSMYNMRVRTLSRLFDRPKIIATMEEYRKTMGSDEKSDLVSSLLPGFEALSSRDVLKYQKLLTIRKRLLFTRWVKYVLALSKPYPWNRDWHVRGLPGFLQVWSGYLPNNGVSYSVEGGRIQFNPKTASIRVTVELFLTPSGETAVKPAEHCYAKPYIGLTRYHRLSRRNELRAMHRTFSPYEDAEEDEGFEAKASPSRLVPQWFERDEVRDWIPPWKTEASYSQPI